MRYRKSTGEDMGKKIVLTGGPGGGKTTALDLFRREFVKNLTIVPEAATILFEHGFPRGSNADELKMTQQSIYLLQIQLEDIFALRNPEHCLLCDRGTLDSFAYWPGELDEFFQVASTSFEKEVSRYDAVIFFETGAAGGSDIRSNNPQRTEGQKQAIELDKKLKSVWSQHPNFHFISSQDSFIDKVMAGLETIREVLGKS